MLVGPEFVSARNADAFVVRMAIAKMAQRLLRNGLPWRVVANDVLVTEQPAMGAPIPNVIRLMRDCFSLPMRKAKVKTCTP